jgi:hypothetical protein
MESSVQGLDIEYYLETVSSYPYIDTDSVMPVLTPVLSTIMYNMSLNIKSSISN